MNKRLQLSVLSVALAWCTLAQARVDLSLPDKQMTGPRSQVLVLGTEHLSGMPKSFRPESMEPVLSRLAAFRPQIITIEALPGETCDLMARQPVIYDPQDVAAYCRSTVDARTATGLDVTSALGEVSKTLAGWPAQPTPVQRRHLAALFLAANDGASALTQWLQLPQAERHTGDGLDEALVAQLDKLASSNNEDFLIAARLAARLGLQRVFPIDDHTGDNIIVSDAAAYGKAIQQAWDAAGAQALPMRKQEEALKTGGDMLALYRYINRPDVLRLVVASDFGAALRDTSPQHYGQLYVAGWETRNLRMVANVRAAFREQPGARVLSIVGSSHKPWFDDLLEQMQGVEVVDAEKVLQGPPD